MKKIHCVEFEQGQKIPARMVARHNGEISGNLALFPTLEDHKAFLVELQNRVNELMAAKGLPSFNIAKG